MSSLHLARLRSRARIVAAATGALLLACAPKQPPTPPEPAPHGVTTPDDPAANNMSEETGDADAASVAAAGEPGDDEAAGDDHVASEVARSDAGDTELAAAPDGPRAHCPAMGDTRFVYAFGSSTMASLLGPMLKQTFQRRWGDVQFRKWGKASSGMARPDFHDWIKEIPGLNEDYDPDVYIVNLGTNDAQPLWDAEDKWIHATTPEWKRRYGERVDAILELMAGEDHRRLIVWVGPTAFPSKNSRQIGPMVNEVLKERIEAFEGDAFYVDAFTTTSPKRGQYIKTVTLGGKSYPAYGDDGVHLTNDAVKALLFRPLMKIVAPCLDPVER